MALKLSREQAMALKAVIAGKKSVGFSTNAFMALTKGQQKEVKEIADMIYNGVGKKVMGACVAAAIEVVKSMDKKPTKRKP